MAIEFNCKGCGQRYRVSDALAGRVAECKHCGQQMTVPTTSQPPSSTQQASPPAERKAQREPSYEPPDIPTETESGRGDDFADVDAGEFEFSAPEPEHAKVRRQRQVALLPEILTDLILPVAMLLGCLGGATWLVTQRILHSNNVWLGFALLGVSLALYFFMIIPITIRGLESAAGSLEYQLPNALWLQTAGLLSLPTAAMTAGYFLGGGRSGLIAWGLMGLAAMAALTALMYPTGAIKALTSVVLAVFVYAFATALAAGIVAGLAFGLDKAGLNLPWNEKRVVVAKTEPAPPPPAPEPSTQPMANIPEKPKITEPEPHIETPAPPPPPKEVILWQPVIDPAPALGKWPADLHHLIDIKPPITLAKSSPHSAFVGFADAVAFHVHDLRSGRRTGFIKEKIPAAGTLISPDGTLLLINRSAAPSTGGITAASGDPRLLEIWTVADGKLARQLSFDTGRPPPTILGFGKDNHLITWTNATGKPLVQVWDTSAASPLREFETAKNPINGPALAASGSGKYVACAGGGRVAVFDTESGEQICDQPLPHPAGTVSTLSFSRDGGQILAIIKDNGSNLIVLDSNSGNVTLDSKVAIRPDLAADQLLWIPSGGAVLAGNDWLDTGSGKIVATLPPQTAGQSTGKPKMMINEWQVLIEFAPAGNAQKLIYKAVNLPKKDIQSALSAQHAAPTTKPAESPTTRSS